jgi:hypothetical protein
MGYTTLKHANGTIRRYWPDDDLNTIWISSHQQISLAQIQQLAQEKWPDCDANDIIFQAEQVHTSCLDYDLHDPGDWTCFITIHRCS